MNHYVTAGLGLLAVSLTYYIITSFLAARYHARKAREWGCEPAWERKGRLPLGADLTWEVIQADKKNIVPNYFVDLHKRLGKTTWTQNMLGKYGHVTTDPKNIQAVLATQFNDFELGPIRRSNFFPMFGNGIFTTDGKAWYVWRG
jgi:hypothetical protein